MRIIQFCVVLLGLICASLMPALAQEKYPNRPVHFIVSFAAGGSNDIIARVLCDWLSRALRPAVHRGEPHRAAAAMSARHR